MEKEEKQRIIAELGGIPEEVYDSLIQDLIVQGNEKCNEMQDALEKNDFDAIAQSAHSLKGASGNLRVMNLQECARVIETSAKETKDSSLIQENLQTIQVIVKELSSSSA